MALMHWYYCCLRCKADSNNAYLKHTIEDIKKLF